MIYKTCLPDIPKILPKLCEIIEYDYEIGLFEKKKKQFEVSKESYEDWIINGTSGFKLIIHFKEYEEYLFIELIGKGKKFKIVKKFLYESYINQGGNPEAQEKL